MFTCRRKWTRKSGHRKNAPVWSWRIVHTEFCAPHNKTASQIQVKAEVVRARSNRNSSFSGSLFCRYGGRLHVTWSTCLWQSFSIARKMSELSTKNYPHELRFWNYRASYHVFFKTDKTLTILTQTETATWIDTKRLQTGSGTIVPTWLDTCFRRSEKRMMSAFCWRCAKTQMMWKPVTCRSCNLVPALNARSFRRIQVGTPLNTHT